VRISDVVLSRSHSVLSGVVFSCFFRRRRYISVKVALDPFQSLVAGRALCNGAYALVQLLVWWFLCEMRAFLMRNYCQIK